LWIQNQRDPSQQLQLDQLSKSRAVWLARDNKDYRMVYTVQRGGERGKDLFFVEVRAGTVQSVLLNGTQQLPENQLEYHSMEGLFNDIELFLQKDAQPGSPKTVCSGYFSNDDGHLLWFVRQVVGGAERVEIKVEEFRPGRGH